MSDDEVLSAYSGGVEAYSLKGDLLWRAALRENVPSSLVAADGIVLASEATIQALDAKTGSVVWSYSPNGNTSLGSSAAGDGLFFVGDDRHSTYALRMHTGEIAWALDFDPGWKFREIVRAVTFSNHRIYLSVEKWMDGKGLNITGRLLCLNARSGDLVWSYTTEQEADAPSRTGISSEALVEGGMLYVSDVLGNELRAFHSDSGRLDWKYAGERGYVGVPTTPFLRADVLYAGSGDTHLVALEPRTGRVWSRVPLHLSVMDEAVCGDQLLLNLGGALFVANLPTTDDNAPRTERPLGIALNSRLGRSRVDGEVLAFDENHLLSIHCSKTSLPLH